MSGILCVCTGNAARSVMAGAFLRGLAPGWDVSSAGTHAIEGLPMSIRTRQALAGLGYRADGHRSLQGTAEDLEAADLVIIFEPTHLRWVERTLPSAAARTASLRLLARDLPVEGGLADRVEALDLAGRRFEAWEEVIDPAGGEQDSFDACAAEILRLVEALVVRLGDPPGVRPAAARSPSG